MSSYPTYSTSISSAQITPLVLNDTGYYTIYRSDTNVYQFSVNPGTWLKGSIAHTSFKKNQMWSIRFWISQSQIGPSISGLPDASSRYLSPLKIGQYFAVYDANYPKPFSPDLSWIAPVGANVNYWMNIRNMENKDNSFYLKYETLPLVINPECESHSGL